MLSICQNGLNHVQDKAINIRFFSDIVCVLDTRLRVRFFGGFI